MQFRRRSRTLVITGLGILTQTAGATAFGSTRGAAPADLTTILRPILAAHPRVPALFAAVVADGRTSALGAVGVRKAGETASVLPSDLVHLGSDTKAMTAVLVAQLVRDRQLAWTDTVATLFPDLRPSMDAAAAGVTVAELLHHTSGLPPTYDWHALDRSRQLLPEQRRTVVRQAFAAPPLSTPGTRYTYSNLNYVVLGAIVERRTGRAWEQVIADRIFAPAGMTTAGFGFPGTAGTTDEPWGHVFAGGRVTPVQVDNPPVMAPAGEVHCSMADWARFVETFCRPAGDAGSPLLDGATLAALTTPAAGERYAGGWIVVDRPGGRRSLSHDGSNTTWYCRATVFPTAGYAVLAAANCGGADAAAACGEACDALIRLHAPAR